MYWVDLEKESNSPVTVTQVEVCPVRFIQDQVEACPVGEVDAFGVYTRGDDGLAVHVKDFDFYDEAYVYALGLAEEKSVPLVIAPGITDEGRGEARGHSCSDPNGRCDISCMDDNEHTPEVGMVHNPTYPCSCTVRRDGKVVSISYCPMHAAAPKMLEALEESAIEFHEHVCLTRDALLVRPTPRCRKTCKQIRAAIAQARGDTK